MPLVKDNKMKLENERWARIRDSPYWISDHGRVWSIKRDQEIRLFGNNDSYPTFNMTIDKDKQKTTRVHRLVAEYFVQNPDNKPWVNHLDGVKSNNHFKNLEWSTPKENTDHAFNMGLRVPMNIKQHFDPLNHPSRKLTDQDVIDIKTALLNAKYGMIKFLAEKYSVHQATIQRIKYGKAWSHITIKE
jgi:hypothetical protein